jgi:hypothetical protein
MREDIVRRLLHPEKIFALGIGNENSHLTLRVDRKTERLTPEQLPGHPDMQPGMAPPKESPSRWKSRGGAFNFSAARHPAKTNKSLQTIK